MRPQSKKYPVLLELSDVIKITKLSRSLIYLYISKGIFPKQVPIGERRAVWIEEEIYDWINSKIKEREC